MLKADIGDLELALEFVSGDPCYECNAFLCKESGEILYDSDGSEDDIPEDIYENEIYIEIPSKRDLDLGKGLVLKFVKQYLLEDIEKVYEIFRSRGAYARFKSLLFDRDALERWYKYEQEAQKTALLCWCKDNDIDTSV